MKRIGRRSQAAMEFLMTYGWAIMIVLVVISAFAYFGFFEFEDKFPGMCSLRDGLYCRGHSMVSGACQFGTATALKLNVKNSLAHRITLWEFRISEDSDYLIGSGKTKNLGQQLMAAGNYTDIYTDLCDITDTSGQPLDKGEAYQIEFSIIVRDEQSKLEIAFPGTIRGTVI